MTERATEAQFLAGQADAARAGIKTSLHEFVHQVTVDLGPRKWIRRNPWTSLAAAAGAGVGLGYAVSSKRARPAPETTWREPPAGGDPPPQAQAAGLAKLILLPLFASLGQAAKVALNRFLIGLVESTLAAASVARDSAETSEAEEPEQEVPAAG